MKTRQIEIERKFLVHGLPKGLLEPLPCLHIRQGYLQHEKGQELRIRQKSTQYFLTVKRGSRLKRLEVEICLEKSQFDALWPLTEKHRVEKCRYEIPFCGQTLELDVFEGDLAPLMIMEVEFEDEAASRQFVTPDFVGQEVTDNPAYKNVNLATQGLPKQPASSAG